MMKITAFARRLLGGTNSGDRTGTSAAPSDDRAGFRSFELEANEVMSRSKTQRAQLIVRAAVVVLVLLIGWASLARVDEITKGDARVISSRDRKSTRLNSSHG